VPIAKNVNEISYKTYGILTTSFCLMRRFLPT